MSWFVRVNSSVAVLGTIGHQTLQHLIVPMVLGTPFTFPIIIEIWVGPLLIFYC